MAIVAYRDGTMTSFHPAVKLFVHDMTVGACRRIVRQIRISFRVDESVRTHTEAETECDANEIENVA